MKTFDNDNLVQTKEIEYQTPNDVIIDVKEPTNDDNFVNLNINEEQSKNEALINNNTKNIDSSEDYKSALSHMTYQSMTSQSQISSLKNKKIPFKTNKKFENVQSENSLFGESSDDESKDESIFNEIYDDIRKCIVNNEISRINQFKEEINANEIRLRKEKHNRKLKKLLDLEEHLKNSRGNYIIENNEFNDDFILANIDPNKGYEIITREELNKNFEEKKFKDYEYYIEKTF
jgi:hypothetical protein